MTDAGQKVMIALEKVSLSYHANKGAFEDGEHRILNEVSLVLHEGETLGVIGRNGCGKSTILRLLAGIIAPTAGMITFSRHASSALLTLGLGFKANLSGRDNSILSAMLQGSTRKQANSILDQIQEFAELGDSFDEPVKTYSSGMRSRLGFAAALKTHVDILLVDEVLSVGDAHFKKKAEAAIRDRIDGDQTVVFVSHSDAQIESLCDRAIWLNDGRIAAEGDTKEVLANYRQFIQTLK